MAFFGHTGRQRPQPTHLSVSILHFPFSKVGALWAQAEADKVNQAPILNSSALGDLKEHTHDHFHDLHPDTDWKHGLEYAEKIGIGTREYELIEVL